MSELKSSFDVKNVGRQIKHYRKLRKINQIELAEELGISRTHLSDIERGSNCPTLKMLVMIANILEVRVDNLLLGYSIVDDLIQTNLLFESIKKLDKDRRSMIMGIVDFFIENEEARVTLK